MYTLQNHPVIDRRFNGSHREEPTTVLTGLHSWMKICQYINLFIPSKGNGLSQSHGQTCWRKVVGAEVLEGWVGR